MPVNKVVFGGQTLIDLTGDTVTPDTLAVGTTAHDKTGAQITGIMESGGSEKYGATVDTFLGDINASGVLQTPTAQTDLVFDGVTDLANYALRYRFFYNPAIRSASFPQLVQVSGRSAMDSCFQITSLENISFPVLQSVTGVRVFYNAFYGTSIQSVSFPALTTVSGKECFYNAFFGCEYITSVSFPVLEEVTGQHSFERCFYYCSALTNVSFPKLKKIGSDTETDSENNGQFIDAFNTTKVTSLEFPELTALYCSGGSNNTGTFANNKTIRKIYFPKLTVIDKSPTYPSGLNAHKYIFSGCNSLTEIHFGAANQAAIEATEGYPTLWGRGAGNATVYFDL